MRSSGYVLGILCGVLLPVSASAQKPLFWAAPNWFEVGVTYPKSAPVAQITLGCAADKYSNSVDWGDGTSTQMSTPGAEYKVTYHGETMTLIGPGTFYLYATSDKEFGPEAAENPHTASITSTLHCLDASETEHWQSTQTLHVRARAPLRAIGLSASADKPDGTTLDVKSGSAFKVRITTIDRVSLAKGHVDLKWTDPANVLVSPPTSVDMPFLYTNVEFVVQTAKTKKKQSVMLRASTIGDPLQATINIVP
ncbi:MAG: hypothetical protein WBX38_02110 [Candidatus Sulfotelmatobacter sp.]